MRWDSRNPFDWHRWFAWHPVEVGTQWVWLETVERRLREYPYLAMPDYRLLEK